MLGTLLIILLVLAVVGAVPRWGYSRDWGYFPSGGLGLILLIVLILARRCLVVSVEAWTRRLWRLVAKTGRLNPLASGPRGGSRGLAA